MRCIEGKIITQALSEVKVRYCVRKWETVNASGKSQDSDRYAWEESP
jgi:hypothetical protein